MACFMERLRRAEAKYAAAEIVDPWRLPLERVHGKIGDDGIERITTQLLFDILEVPQHSRGAGAAGAWRSLWPSLGGWRCVSGGSRAAVIWSKFAGTAANRSVRPDRRVATAAWVGQSMPTNTSD